MCSIGDDNYEEENSKHMHGKEKFSLSDKCNKCREKVPCVVLRSKDKYCRGCFLAGATHKFKSLLGKHKLIRPNDRVLVVHKGGNPSSALLHLIRSGLDLETHKKLRFEPVVVFVEEHPHLSLQEQQKLVEEIGEEVLRFKFEFHKFSLDLSQNQRNNTNQLQYMKTVERNSLIEIAKGLKCKFIFTSELSADVASKLLTDISLGKGNHTPLDTGFCDTRDPFVKILRPLRLFDQKEIVFYNYFNNIIPVVFYKPPESPYDSVQSLLKKFVADLQLNYPATVTTVLKTGDKLSIGESDVKCKFCFGPIFEEKNVLSAAESTGFSHWVSTQVLDHSITPQERYSATVQSFKNCVQKDYCFSCQKLNLS